MKEKRIVYEKPLLTVVEVELNECIANSEVTVEKGQSAHTIVNGSELGGDDMWGDIINLDGNGKPVSGKGKSW